MLSSFKVQLGSSGFALAMLACGGSSSTPDPGDGGSATVVGASASSVATGSGGATVGSSVVTGGTATGGGGGAGGSTGSGGSGGSGDAAVLPAANAVALYNSKLPSSLDRKRWLTSGETLSPSTLIIAVSTQPLACAAPNLNDRVYPSETLVLVGLPDAMQKPGTYDLSSNDVIGWGRTWVGDGMGNGGGTPSGIPIEQGTIEIVSMSQESIDVRFDGLPSLFGFHNGKAYSALRCP